MLAGQRRYFHFSVILGPWVPYRPRESSPWPLTLQLSALPTEVILPPEEMLLTLFSLQFSHCAQSFLALSGTSQQQNVLRKAINHSYSSGQENKTMNSQRIVIFIALWLILSCFLLDHAEGFLHPRPRKRFRYRKRGRGKYLIKQAAADFAFLLEVCMWLNWSVTNSSSYTTVIVITRKH